MFKISIKVAIFLNFVELVSFLCETQLVDGDSYDTSVTKVGRYTQKSPIFPFRYLWMIPKYKYTDLTLLRGHLNVESLFRLGTRKFAMSFFYRFKRRNPNLLDKSNNIQQSTETKTTFLYIFFLNYVRYNIIASTLHITKNMY